MRAALFALVAASAGAVEVLGNGRIIPNGELYPAGADGTQMSTVCVNTKMPPRRTFTIKNPDKAKFLTFDSSPVVRVQGTRGHQDGEKHFQVFQPVSNFVGPDQNTTFEVEFHATSAGVKLGELTVSTSDGDYIFGIGGIAHDNAVEVQTLTDYGRPAQLIDFGRVGTTQKQKNILVTNGNKCNAKVVDFFSQSQTLDNEPFNPVGKDYGFSIEEMELPQIVDGYEQRIFSKIFFKPGPDGEYSSEWVVETEGDGGDFFFEVIATVQNGLATKQPTNQPTSQPTTLPPSSASQPTSSPPLNQCSDETLTSGEPWHDALGTQYDCAWYKSDPGNCDAYGGADAFPLGSDLTAKKACCTCGGGNACNDKKLPGGAQWSDLGGPEYTCAWYEETGPAITVPRCIDFGSDPYWMNTYTAAQACCACGGGDTGDDKPKPQCYDRKFASGAPWHDIGGSDFGCGWYEIGQRCTEHGNSHLNEYTAADACCFCGGGTDEAPAAGKCVDLTFANGGVWNDDYGPEYGCEHYSQDQRCSKEGGKDEYRNEHIAQEACCACGGGQVQTEAQCEDKKFASGAIWNDEYGAQFNCEWYANNDACSTDGGQWRNEYTAQEACCACEGGNQATQPVEPTEPVQPTEPAACVDKALASGGEWSDAFGGTCLWYGDEGNDFRCNTYGNKDRNEFVAQEACCFCGGGV